MLEHGHNYYLVAASLAIVVMAGFTGLSLTRGASSMELGRRKLVVCMAAIVLGGGIWSMHFVAMLGLTLPVQFYYDALTTMISALVAILLTGVALLIVHFGKRTKQRILFAGLCVGVGIPAMHYIGMSGMESAEPVYSITGIIVAFISSLVLCVGSFWICYGERQARNILLGTAGFGVAVFAVHFIAMLGTHFVEVPGATSHTLRLDNEILAFGVTLSSFAIAGAFLLVGVTFADESKTVETAPQVNDKVPAAAPSSSQELATPDFAVVADGRIPYEKNSRIHFLPLSEISAVRAEGHYTFLYHHTGKLFCPWSLSQFEGQIKNSSFLKCHRSYLINLEHVSGFERRKDTGVCFFEDDIPLEQVPVSRSYLKQVRDGLGL